MKLPRSITIFALLFAFAQAQTLFKDIAVTGTGNQVRNGATWTAKSGSTTTFESGATLNLGNATITWPTTGVSAGTFGSATQSLTATVDASGRLTSLAAQTVTPAWSSITSKPTTLAGYGIADSLTSAQIAAGYQPLDSDLTAIAALSTTSYGRSTLSLADAAAGRAYFGLAAIAASGSASDLTTGTLPAARLPSEAVTLTGTQTLTNKTFTAPILTGAVSSSGSISITGSADGFLAYNNPAYPTYNVRMYGVYDDYAANFKVNNTIFLRTKGFDAPTQVTIPLATASTSSTTGALVVVGGVGVGGSINAGGTITQSGNLVANNADLLARTNNKTAWRALSFNGTASIPVSFSAYRTYDFCLRLLYRPSAINAYNTLAHGAAGSLYVWAPANGTLNIQKVGSGGYIAQILNVFTAANRWYDVVIRRASGTLTIDVDGTQVYSGADATDFTAGITALGATTGSTECISGVLNAWSFNCTLTAAQLAHLRETGTVSRELLPNLIGQPAGVTLNTTAFANAGGGTGYEYETFTGASATGFTAVNTSGQGFAYVNGGAAYVVLPGTEVGIIYDLTVNSGQAPYLQFSSQSAQLTAGTNQITKLTIASGATSYFGISNTAASNYALANARLFFLGCEFAIDPNWDARGGYAPNIAGNGNHAKLPASGVYPTGAPGVRNPSQKIDLLDGSAGSLYGPPPILSFTTTAGTAYTSDQVLASLPLDVFVGGEFLVSSNITARKYVCGTYNEGGTLRGTLDRQYPATELTNYYGVGGGYGAPVGITITAADGKCVLNIVSLANWTAAATKTHYVQHLHGLIKTTVVK